MVLKLDSIFADKITLDGVYDSKEAIDNLYPIKPKLETLFANIGDINVVTDNIEELNIVAEYADELLNINNATAFIEIELEGTVGQTNFGFNYEDAESIEVFYNGRLLSQADWYLSDGTTLTLTMPVDTTGDILTVRTWNRFSITDAITDEDLQTVYNNVYLKSQVDMQVTALSDQISNALAAVSSLATAQGTFGNTGPVISPLLTAHEQMLWTVSIPSTNETIFKLNPDSSITFYKNASYNFLSTLGISSSTNSERTIYFELINTADNSVIGTETKVLDYPQGENTEVSFNTLLTIGKNGLPEAPVTMKVFSYASDIGFSIDYFTSILVSSNAYQMSVDYVGSIDDFETALV